MSDFGEISTFAGTSEKSLEVSLVVWVGVIYVVWGEGSGFKLVRKRPNYVFYWLIWGEVGISGCRHVDPRIEYRPFYPDCRFKTELETGSHDLKSE